MKWRLIRAEGSRRERPPPVPPPFWPKTGPSDGSRSAHIALTPFLRAAWVRPMVQVVLPSPAGVGLMAETRTSRAFGRIGAEGHLGADLRHVGAPGLDVLGRETQVVCDVFDRAHGMILDRLRRECGQSEPIAREDQ